MPCPSSASSALPPQGLVWAPVVQASMFAVTTTALRLLVEAPATLAALPSVPSSSLGLHSVMSLSDEQRRLSSSQDLHLPRTQASGHACEGFSRLD